MQASFSTLKGTVNVVVEGDTQQELFEELASAQEIFQHDCCGVCKGSNIKFVVREVDKNKFYELHCETVVSGKTCRARLPFGCINSKDGKLFPKKRWSTLSDTEKEKRGPEPESGYLPNEGWFRWKKEQ